MALDLFNGGQRTKNTTTNTDNSQTAGEGARVSQFRSGGDRNRSAQADAGALAISGSYNETVINNQSLDGQVLEFAGTLLGKSIQAQSNLAGEALQGNAHLAETRLTDGQNIVGKNAVWIVLGLAALFAAVLFFKNR